MYVPKQSPYTVQQKLAITTEPQSIVCYAIRGWCAYNGEVSVFTDDKPGEIDPPQPITFQIVPVGQTHPRDMVSEGVRFDTASGRYIELFHTCF